MTASLVFQKLSDKEFLRRVETYRNVTASEEMIGDQPEVDVIHIPLKGSGVFGSYKVNRGRLQLQRHQTMLD